MELYWLQISETKTATLTDAHKGLIAKNYMDK